VKKSVIEKLKRWITLKIVLKNQSSFINFCVLKYD
jgi:hypothetical protein